MSNIYVPGSLFWASRYTGREVMWLIFSNRLNSNGVIEIIDHVKQNLQEIQRSSPIYLFSKTETPNKIHHKYTHTHTPYLNL